MVSSYPVVSVYNSTYAVRPDNDPATEFVYNPATGHSLAAVCVFGDYHCMATFYGGSSISFRRSEDAGETWDDQGGIGPLFSGSPVALRGYTYDGVDRLVLAYRSSHSSSCRYAIAYSDDIGETWTHVALYSGGGPAGGLMDMHIDRTTGVIFVSYCTAGGWMFAKSADGGETWTHAALGLALSDSPYLGGRAPIVAQYPYVVAVSGYSHLEKGDLGEDVRFVSFQTCQSSDYGATWTGDIVLPLPNNWDGRQGLSRGWARCIALALEPDGWVRAYCNETHGYISTGGEFGFVTYRFHINGGTGGLLGPGPEISFNGDYLDDKASCATDWDADVSPFAVATYRDLDDGGNWRTVQWTGPSGNELDVDGGPGIVGAIYDGPSPGGSHSFWW